MSVSQRTSLRWAPFTVVLAVVLALGCAGFATSASAAEQAIWHMLVSSRPSNLKSGGAAAEVEKQQLATEEGSSGLDVFEIEVEGGTLGVFVSGGGRPPVTAEDIQKALEANGAYKEAGVSVSGGPVPAPFIVTTANRHVSHPLSPVMLVFPYASFYGTKYGSGEAKLISTAMADGEVALLASNIGDTPAEGGSQPIVIANHLPSSLEALAMLGKTANPSIERASVTCSVSSTIEGTCEFSSSLPVYEAIEVAVWVRVKGAQIGKEDDSAHVEGGDARMPASGTLALSFGSEPEFGVQNYEMNVEADGGGPVTQAGAHPFQMTTSEVLDQNAEGNPVGMAKDLEFKLPQGFVGNPTVYPHCSLGEFLNIVIQPLGNECRPETAVGIALATIRLKGQIETFSVPVFNLEPDEGEPARFGFDPAVPVVLDTAVRTGEDYGVTVSSHNITQLASLLSAQVTLWGVPGNPAHDQARGWGCLRATQGVSGYTCKPEEQRNATPFLSMPTSCSGPMQAPMLADSWQRPGYFREFSLVTPMPGLVGCNKERFEPSLETARPDLQHAGTPTGLTVDVHVPQNLQTVAGATAESSVKQIDVTLPDGMTLNPGGADGLTSCTEAEIGYLGKEEPEKEVAFEHFTSDYPSCPDSSKIATVTIHTPLLPHPIEGFVYLATPSINGEPGDNPFNSLISMYLVAQDPVSGVLVKLPMRVELNPATGQLVTKVDNPELPFEDAELHLFGGSRAPLATPAMCGTYTTKAVFTPWSGNAPVDSNATFTIDSGPGGGSCLTSPKPFAPSLQAGATNLQAGGYTPFTTTLGHPDGNQYLGSVSMKLPPGLMGSLSGVKLCPEPQAAQGTCGPESLIGHTTVTAGLGSNPAVVARPGNVYITVPYNGHDACKVGEAGCAPFGLTVANPAETGPFDLEKGTACDCVVVRAKVEVNPITAQLTVTSDPLPTILKGIPLQLQHVNMTIERPGFTFNPTNCEPLSIDSTIASSEGASASVSTRFQVANCATLGFKPQFRVSTPGKTSRKDGAGLDVKLLYPTAPFGSQANIAKVKVDLPKQLPSRLSTLQKACLASTFEANPSACPTGSRVGFAKATTPVLPVPLEGPAYFVSYGAKKFPELIIVLQGYGVTIDLHGETFISKAGITTSTFRQVPDVPVGSFELKLPQGPNSALAANANLCKATYTVTSTRRVRARIKGRSMYVTVKVAKRVHGLRMPTAFIAQNGATIHTSTPISVTGCARARRNLHKTKR